jgi:two-component system response regulator FixJ
VRQDAPGRVFFVDDEPRVCRVVRRTLERQGVIVRCFSNAADCLAELEVTLCDVLITDVKMPGMDGIELLAEVRRKYPRLPVLVLTGFGDIPMAVKALRQGAVDFIEKPFDRDGFLEAVQTTLAQVRKQDSQLSDSLTKTEMTVLRLLLEGRKNREIATILHRSTRTVEVHRSHLMRKMGACNLAELLRRAADLALSGSDQSRMPDRLSGGNEPDAGAR